MTEIREIATEDEMRALLDESLHRSVVLLKYSPTCGISMVAEERWNEWTGAAPEGVLLARCDVLGARPAARGITAWLGIPHQSPQVLVLEAGACTAHTSHYSITVDWLAKALA